MSILNITDSARFTLLRNASRGQRRAVLDAIHMASKGANKCETDDVLKITASTVKTKEQTTEYVTAYYLSELRKAQIAEGGYTRGNGGGVIRGILKPLVDHGK